MGDGLKRARSAAKATRQPEKMSDLPWIVHHRDGWCALPPGAEPDPQALNDPTLCGYVVTMRGGSKRGLPTCTECLALLEPDHKPGKEN